MKFVNDYRYLLEFDFPSSQFLEKHKDSLFQAYVESRKTLYKGNDFTLINSPINHYFNQKIKNLIEDNFYLNHTNVDIGLNLYVQDNENNASIFHNHSHTPSSICGVFYYNIPKEGGEFEVFDYPNHPIENSIQFKPQEDKIYVFPPWLYHRPLPQKDKTPRLCINFQYIGDSRPIMKKFGFIW